MHPAGVSVVGRAFDLPTKPAGPIPADKELYQRQIDAADEEIDPLVYELYGLAAEEIAIVEEETK